MSRLRLHYKDKRYRFLFVARHSETREELAVYETLYESPGGRLWARPLEMFEGDVEHEGTTRRRFAPVEVEVRRYGSDDAQAFKRVQALADSVFGPGQGARIARRSGRPGFAFWIASFAGQDAAFKVGYPEDETAWYSWLGGTLESWRGLGAASALARAQENYARSEGYVSVRTKSRNRFRDMVRLNLSFGFDVVGVEAAPGREPKILMEKSLRDDGATA